MPWNLTSDRPIFMQLIEIIQHDIISGKYAPGDKLPSVQQPSIQIPCRKPSLNWKGAVWCIPSEQADDL